MKFKVRLTTQITKLNLFILWWHNLRFKLSSWIRKSVRRQTHACTMPHDIECSSSVSFTLSSQSNIYLNTSLTLPILLRLFACPLVNRFKHIHQNHINQLTAFYHTKLIIRGHRLELPVNPYPTAFPYGNGMVLHFYQQQESSTTKTVHKVINKGLKTYV